jgi:hypothetical protein
MWHGITIKCLYYFISFFLYFTCPSPYIHTIWWEQQLACANQGRIQDFKLGGAHLKKLRRAKGGANIFGVFRVKSHDFTPKNHIFSDCGGRRENFWGILCEKSRFYAEKIIFYPILGGGGVLDPPLPTLYSYYPLLLQQLVR